MKMEMLESLQRAVIKTLKVPGASKPPYITKWGLLEPHGFDWMVV